MSRSPLISFVRHYSLKTLKMLMKEAVAYLLLLSREVADGVEDDKIGVVNVQVGA